MSLWKKYKKKWPNFIDQDDPTFLYQFINWCFNNPEDPALEFIEKSNIKTYYGAGVIYLSHQCKYMEPIKTGIRNTFYQIIDALIIPNDRESQVKLIKEIVSYVISQYSKYWHDYMLAYTRMSLIMASTRAEYFAGNLSYEDALDDLISYNVTKEEAEALLEKQYKPTEKRFTFPSQRDMLNYVKEKNS